MLYSCQSSIGKWTRLFTAFFLVLTAANLTAQPLAKEATAESLDQALPSLPISWVSGSDRVNLGSVAEIAVPRNWKFADAVGARAFLEGLKTSVPDGLIGVLAPSAQTEAWYVILEYAPIGFVSNPDKETLDADAMLKDVQQAADRQDNGLRLPAKSVGTVSWESKPAFDASNQRMTWAIKTSSGYNYTVRLLGRHGVLDATTVRITQDAGGLASLKQLVDGLSFKKGEQYAEHQSGDEVAKAGLSQLILADTSTASTAQEAANRSLGFILPLSIGSGVVALAVIGFVYFNRSSRRRRSASARSSGHAAEPAASAQPAASQEPVAAEPKLKLQTSLSNLKYPSKQTVQSAPKKSVNGANGTNGHHRGPRRKKVFDYNRYFTDLMSTVSNSGLIEAPSAIEFPSESARAVSPAPVPHLAPASSAIHGANSDIIATQKALIEEQKHLIKEQTRLIEEKSKLIAEKNQLLKMQSEWIETKLL
jgi:uncharacterized membrane-anchored protein